SSSVVLPAPLGPSRATTSPRRTVRSTSRTARTGSRRGDLNDLARPRISTAGVGGSLSLRDGIPRESRMLVELNRESCHDFVDDNCHGDDESPPPEVPREVPARRRIPSLTTTETTPSPEKSATSRQ